MAAGFKGVPRGMVLSAIADMQGFRTMAERMTARAIADCPVSENDGGDGGGTHLRDTLVYKLITGSDPRILIGTNTQGEKLGWITNGTEPHSIDPVNATVLRFTSGGTTVFAQHVDHPGHPEPNPFLRKAIEAIAQER